MCSTDIITVAILAKDKAHVLPLYLKCIENQTYPASKINLYIRTNNNNDDTAAILKAWVKKVRTCYHEIYLDDSDVPEQVQEFAPHEWNGIRFKVLGKIRQDSIEWAKQKGTHYFIADCDNFIIPETIERLYTSNLPTVAPLLRNADSANPLYSNYHYLVDENGYYKDSPLYYHVLDRSVKGFIEVEVIHCTYFIQNSILPYVCYDDHSGRYEYVIFSDTLRKAGIPQYIDNRFIYGSLTFCDTSQDFLSLNLNF